MTLPFNARKLRVLLDSSGRPHFLGVDHSIFLPISVVGGIDEGIICLGKYGVSFGMDIACFPGLFCKLCRCLATEVRG